MFKCLDKRKKEKGSLLCFGLMLEVIKSPLRNLLVIKENFEEKKHGDSAMRGRDGRKWVVLGFL